jgi:response regulator RpfG family c-di-GMP phosphodiesterase
MKVLIIDDDSDIRDIIEFTFSCEVEADFVHANSGNEAIKIIKNSKDLDLIICDYNMPDGNGGDVYSFLIENNIEIPYAFCSSESSKDHKAFDNQKLLLGDITKPYIFEGIQKIIDNYNHGDFKKEKIHKNKSDYICVHLDILLKAKSLPCDIYLELNNQKIIKILNENDSFTSEEYEKYKDKGLSSLLILREKAVVLINYLVHRIEAILIDDSRKSEDKILDVHSVIMSTVAHLGLSEKVVRAAAASVEFALKAFEQSPQFKALESHIFGNPKHYLTTHSIALAFISVAILKNTSWDTPDTRNKLVLAAFLHDATIRDPMLSESLFDEDPKLLTVKEHPIEVQEILKKLKNIPPDLDRILLEHHERPQGTGFPKGLTGSQLHPLSSIFIFSHDIVDHIFKLQENGVKLTEANIQSEIIIDDYSIGNFEKCYNAFLKTTIFK